MFCPPKNRRKKILHLLSSKAIEVQNASVVPRKSFDTLGLHLERDTKDSWRKILTKKTSCWCEILVNKASICEANPVLPSILLCLGYPWSNFFKFSGNYDEISGNAFSLGLSMRICQFWHLTLWQFLKKAFGLGLSTQFFILMLPLRHFINSRVYHFGWNIDTAVSHHQLPNKTLTSLTVEPSKLYFWGLIITIHSIQTIELARQKIEDFFVHDFHFEKIENTTLKSNKKLLMNTLLLFS